MAATLQFTGVGSEWPVTVPNCLSGFSTEGFQIIPKPCRKHGHLGKSEGKLGLSRFIVAGSVDHKTVSPCVVFSDRNEEASRFRLTAVTANGS